MISPISFQQEYGISDDQLESVKHLSSLAEHAQQEQTVTSIITTHCAHIIITKDRVYKIKRAVKYSYVDMSSLAAREQLCKRELELNKPTLPNIYLKVVPLTESQDGILMLDGTGKIVEWVLIMKRFSQRRVLDNMAANGSLSVEIAKQIGRSIFQYHDSLPSQNTMDGYDRMDEIVNELIGELSNKAHGFDKTLLNTFIKKSNSLVKAHATLLNLRASTGYVKRCHGDLHLRNMVLMHDGPHPFDALEFDERLATIDVLYDLAFILMDLSHRELNSQQNALLNQYLARCEPADLNGLALLPLFLFCRAGIKAMTTAQNTDVNQPVPNPEAVDYLQLALSYLNSQSTALIAVGGYSGSGKSTIATHLAAAQNAVLLDSDVERKAHLHVSENQPLQLSAYTEKSAQLNYQRLIEKAEVSLKANQTVIVDATFLNKVQRQDFESLAVKNDRPFVGIWLDVPTAILESRLRNRPSNASDATVEILRIQLKRSIGDLNWHKIDASDSLDATMARIQKLITSQMVANLNEPPSQSLSTQ